MNSSLATADRTTHLKVVIVALVAAILVVTAGIAARVTSIDTRARAHSGRGGREGGYTDRLHPHRDPFYSLNLPS